MQPSRFDRLSQRLSRRTSLRWLAGIGVAATFGSDRVAAQGSPVANGGSVADDNATLFVQTATAGTFRLHPAAATPASGTPGTGTALPPGAYLLTLSGHSGETIAFSDRPQRNFGEVKTPQFFKSMGFTPVDPPNAALVTDTPQQEDVVVLLDLMTPAYDAATHTLTYEANLLQQYRGEALKPLATRAQNQRPSETFGSASLFIDDCPAITECGYSINTQYFEVGPIPGGPFAMCWDAISLSCVPCLQDFNMLGLTQICNSAYPKQCGGVCVPS